MNSVENILSNKVYSSRKNHSIGYVYQILNIINGKLYVGSTIDFSVRKRTHIRALKDNKHVNKHLQYSWNKYGEEAFIIEVIECVIDVSTLAEREQFYMDLHKSYEGNVGYNINRSATSSLGRKVSSETREKIRQAHLKENRKGENSHQWGRKWSQEVKDKISKIHKGKIMTTEMRKNMSDSHIGIAQGVKNPMSKLTESQVQEIKLLWKYGDITTSDIARYFSITKSGVDNIVYLRCWSHVEIDGICELSSKLKELIKHSEISALLRNKEAKKQAKLTTTMLKDLLILLQFSDLAAKELAELYYVNRSAIYSIKNKKSFKKEINKLEIEINWDEDCLKIINKYKEYNTLIENNKELYSIN